MIYSICILILNCEFNSKKDIDVDTSMGTTAASYNCQPQGKGKSY